MMITFSTSGMLSPVPYFTLYSECSSPSPRSVLPPALDGAPQLEVGDHAGDQRQPERERAEQQHGDDGQAGVDPERRERRDHPALDAADAARHRQQVAEHADEERLDEHRERRRVAERVEARPQHRDLEGPEQDRAGERGVRVAQVLERVAHPGRGRGGQVGEPLRPAGRAARGRARSPPRGAAGRSARARSRRRSPVRITRDDRRHDRQRERRLAGEDPEPQAEARRRSARPCTGCR